MSCAGCAFNNTVTEEKVDIYNWLNDLPDTSDQSDIVEVKFKTTRKEFYRNTDDIPLKRGDKVIVATSPGHDVGEVTLTGYLAEKQFDRKVKNKRRYTLNTIYRKATENDLQVLASARKIEKSTLIRSRQLAADLGLDMKIGEVEYRGDGKKAIFYYIADGRVDFRELIKLYAREFRIKVEMKQIGARQEAGLVGGIGSCGRELCCSSWRTDFSSISSDAAQKQGLSPSAQKMAGACGKLKCCLLYELDTYMEARQEFPEELMYLEMSKGIAKPLKTDYLKKEIWFTIEGDATSGTFALSLKEVKDIIQQNKRGKKPELPKKEVPGADEIGWQTMNNESIDRFENKNPRKNKPRKKKNNYRGRRQKDNRQRNQKS
ncbi:Cell fate regulator YaaT, PSP1 superfamily (controls sporulation, competence, biofilm development) [Mariniphaga anaerophila]|uniref:Cell fate regulator YaaT, PSP1 superfamily (Controls sporulation, competence, biofilm development) n=1 Tax=Mariniphaga anaerophila TaxID=1484053 RepID=A0A1M4YVL2_9BACT|nr:regulatory iron-sulfur-containing complex subunit RicT [Mariniphaga anaerophila]SHF09833.1 Cell fate regulator YaaT, PSP1 superfamily (controls sporulation, competence, biofilm development) [Mariniphaga anaerophila]